MKEGAEWCHKRWDDHNKAIETYIRGPDVERGVLGFPKELRMLDDAEKLLDIIFSGEHNHVFGFEMASDYLYEMLCLHRDIIMLGTGAQGQANSMIENFKYMHGDMTPEKHKEVAE